VDHRHFIQRYYDRLNCTVIIIASVSFVADDLITACPYYKTVGIYWVVRKQSEFCMLVNIFYEQDFFLHRCCCHITCPGVLLSRRVGPGVLLSRRVGNMFAFHFCAFTLSVKQKHAVLCNSYQYF